MGIGVSFCLGILINVSMFIPHIITDTFFFTVNHTHINISQLVNKMCSQQACSKLVNKLYQCCYFIKLVQGCHSQLVDKIVELQDDNKLLEQLATTLLS